MQKHPMDKNKLRAMFHSNELEGSEMNQPSSAVWESVSATISTKRDKKKFIVILFCLIGLSVPLLFFLPDLINSDRDINDIELENNIQASTKEVTLPTSFEHANSDVASANVAKSASEESDYVVGKQYPFSQKNPSPLQLISDETESDIGKSIPKTEIKHLSRSKKRINIISRLPVHSIYLPYQRNFFNIERADIIQENTLSNHSISLFVQRGIANASFSVNQQENYHIDAGTYEQLEIGFQSKIGKVFSLGAGIGLNTLNHNAEYHGHLNLDNTAEVQKNIGTATYKFNADMPSLNGVIKSDLVFNTPVLDFRAEGADMQMGLSHETRFITIPVFLGYDIPVSKTFSIKSQIGLNLNYSIGETTSSLSSSFLENSDVISLDLEAEHGNVNFTELDAAVGMSYQFLKNLQLSSLLNYSRSITPLTESLNGPINISNMGLLLRVSYQFN